MDIQQRQESGLPISGGILVIALIIGGLFVQQLGFEGSRPRVPGHGVCTSLGPEDVQARLWEDPFAAVRRHRIDTKDDRHDIHFLAKQIVRTKTREVIVLGVMVFGGPYAENAERRIKSRYATLSALNVLGYVPDDAEHLGYMNIPHGEDKKEDKGTEERLPEIVPYEWFGPGLHSKHKHAILVLWLDDDAFCSTPLAKIGKLKSKLEVEVKTLHHEERSDNSKRPEITFKILGPAGSTNLRAMVDEILDETSGNGWKTLKGIQIFSTSATAAEELLLKKSNDYCNVADLFAKKVKSVAFLRTIRTDSVLTDALVDELARRGADPRDSSNHVALISEWDTFYGRALPRTFIKSVKDKKRESDKKDNGDEKKEIQSVQSIHQFSYLRGIDGQLPDPSNSDAVGSLSSEKRKEDRQTKAVERPVGRRQFDYLRRLATRLERCNERIKRERTSIKVEPRIRAIGVLGSDVYDKLLVLQALRDRFPGAIFFTTDLHASLLHPEEFKWTHNLVIASNFGLELHRKLQKEVPPFRDNYQTSLFFSTMIALDSNQKEIKKRIQKWLQPRIFEVSRSGAFDLSVDWGGGTKDIKLDVLSNGHSLASIHPPRPSLLPSTKTAVFICIALLAAAGFLGLYTWHFKYCRERPFIRSPTWYSETFPIFCPVLAGVIICIYCQGYDGEPFALFDGISLWPTVFLRLFSGVLSVYFLYTGYRKLQDSDDELSRFFVPKPIASHGKSFPAEGGASDGSVDAVSLWKTYSELSNPKRRLTRVFLLSIIYFFFCSCIIHILGQPFVPYRGGISLWVEKIVLLPFAVFPLIFLILGVVDSTKLSVWLIRRLSKRNTAWPEGTTRCLGKELNIDPRYVSDLIDIRVIAKHSEVVGRFICYPFLVMIVMLVSRIPYFDNWNLPLGLLIVISLGMAYAVYCAVILRRSAEQARRMALERLWEQQVHAKGQADETHVAEQIELMIESIRSIRQGAFLPFFQQPLVQALAVFLGGGGSLLLLEYVSWMK